jgi:hypothetical protein
MKQFSIKDLKSKELTRLTKELERPIYIARYD